MTEEKAIQIKLWFEENKDKKTKRGDWVVNSFTSYAEALKVLN